MPAKKEKKSVPADKLALYEQLVATIPDVERKGDSVPYTSINGNMFSYLNDAGMLALRLPKGAREDFLAHYNTTLMEAYGIIQKEYVTVPADLLQKTAELQPIFQASYEYVKSLKPKPTKRPKSADQ